MTNEIKLEGCAPEPLMAYLKALGVFRLVVEQADPSATLSWKGGCARLTTSLDNEALIQFFLHRYQPAPIVAPWNGGSGFYGGGSEPLEVIVKSTGQRLALYRETIQKIQTFVPSKKPTDDDKQALLAKCRSELSDEVIPWLDVCYVLREDRVSFFPLLGTGGNDGRLDFTNNFMQRIADVIPTSPDSNIPEKSQQLLAAALFSNQVVSLKKTAIGQFNPGGIGGPNGIQGSFEAASRVNPWDYVLMIEGALLFAGSAARRFGVSSNMRAVFPFSMDSVAVGYGSATASEETSNGSRSELWLPLWKQPCSLLELRQLFSEGRAQIDGRQARNSVEFALAVNLLGVNRGITDFSRYGFLKRNGLAFLATPLGALEVGLRPQARLLRDPPLTEWIERLRRACSDKDKTPERYQAALRRIDRAMFAFANRSEQGNDRHYLVEVLRAVGSAEQTLSAGLRFADDKGLRPLSRLSNLWLKQADDRTAEFRIAAAVAGIMGTHDGLPPARAYVEPVEVAGRVEWDQGSNSAVWSRRHLPANFAAVLRRRQIEAYQSQHIGVPLDSHRFAKADDIKLLLHGPLDEEKVESLLFAMNTIHWHGRRKEKTSGGGNYSLLPFEYKVMKLVVSPLRIKPERLGNGKLKWKVTHPSQVPSPTGGQARTDVEKERAVNVEPLAIEALSSGRPDAIWNAVEYAARRLKQAGYPVVGLATTHHRKNELLPTFQIKDATTLLGALLVPISDRAMEKIANSVLVPPESEE